MISFCDTFRTIDTLLLVADKLQASDVLNLKSLNKAFYALVPCSEVTRIRDHLYPESRVKMKVVIIQYEDDNDTYDVLLKMYVCQRNEKITHRADVETTPSVREGILHAMDQHHGKVLADATEFEMSVYYGDQTPKEAILRIFHIYTGSIGLPDRFTLSTC